MTVVKVVVPGVKVVKVATGPRGPQGPAGAAGIIHDQSTPNSVWSGSHTLGRLPAIAVYVSGAQILADVTATGTTYNIAFPTPTAGYAVLT